MAKQEKYGPYSPEIIRKKRTFPKSKTIGLFICLGIQVLCILFAVFFTPKPQDRIQRYELLAEPQADGTLDLEYRFVWTALDTSEDLTWVEIGMPNRNFQFYKNSFSSNIISYEKYIDGSYVSARLYLDRAYRGGETLTFSFRVNQEKLLCQDDGGYFYEFVPSWFNATPVEHYSFVWKDDAPISTNATTQKNGYPAWEGSMPCGTYVSMQVQYSGDAFLGASTVEYEEFYDGDVIDSLAEDKIAVIVLMILLCLVMLIIEVYMTDSVVSYHRGRGFLTCYGHHIHVYGRPNPKYEKERDKRAASASRSGRSGGGGRGCACACACACAGGGRAGCSQKDTYPVKIKVRSHT